MLNGLEWQCQHKFLAISGGHQLPQADLVMSKRDAMDSHIVQCNRCLDSGSKS
jgi:hypothetical protein